MKEIKCAIAEIGNVALIQMCLQETHVEQIKSDEQEKPPPHNLCFRDIIIHWHCTLSRWSLNTYIGRCFPSQNVLWDLPTAWKQFIPLSIAKKSHVICTNPLRWQSQKFLIYVLDQTYICTANIFKQTQWFPRQQRAPLYITKTSPRIIQIYVFVTIPSLYAIRWGSTYFMTRQFQKRLTRHDITCSTVLHNHLSIHFSRTFSRISRGETNQLPRSTLHTRWFNTVNILPFNTSREKKYKWISMQAVPASGSSRPTGRQAAFKLFEGSGLAGETDAWSCKSALLGQSAPPLEIPPCHLYKESKAQKSSLRP